ncbi:MAG: hypothetical protein WKF57_06140 [Nakamurella sp.]
MSTPTRVQAGVPTGGQFAQTQRPEAKVSLSPLMDYDPWDSSSPVDPYYEWTAAGIDRGEADQWQKLQVPLSQAKQWKAIPSDPDTAKSFIDANFTPQTAKQWILHKIDPAEANQWIHHGAPKPYVAAQFRGEGFTPETAAGFLSEKYTASSAARWRDAGLNGDDAQEWADDGMEMALEWHETHDSKSANAWVEVGITRARVAERWEALQQSPSDVERWLQVGMYRPDLAEPWISHGFDSGETFQWTAQQFDADQAAGCRASGMTPRQAIEFALAGMAS